MRRTARQTGPERRKTILVAAAEVFAARGYPAASMREIAAAAGITKPVLYDHFPSKDELFIRIIEGARDELVASSAAAMQLDAATEDRVRTAIGWFFEHVERQPAMARLLFAVPEGDSQVVEAVLRVQADATTSLASLLDGEPDLLQGEHRLELEMEFIKKGLHGLALWWLDHPATPRTVVAEAATAVAWGGLRALFEGPKTGVPHARALRVPAHVTAAGAGEDAQPEAAWEPPPRSNRAPGEETVQVNDAYTGGDAPSSTSHGDDEQRPTGG